MELIFTYKFVHLVAAAILLGTGLGVVFLLLKAHRTGHAGVIAVTARFVLVANLIFVAAALLVLLVSGFLLAWAIGVSPLEESWIVLSLVLFALICLCWVPAVLMLRRMRDLAHGAAINGKPLPDQYLRLFRIWAVLGDR